MAAAYAGGAGSAGRAHALAPPPASAAGVEAAGGEGGDVEGGGVVACADGASSDAQQSFSSGAAALDVTLPQAAVAAQVGSDAQMAELLAKPRSHLQRLLARLVCLVDVVRRACVVIAA